MDGLLSRSTKANRACKLLLVFPALGQGCTEAQKDQRFPYITLHLRTLSRGVHVTADLLWTRSC